jgi:hypothetical protein
MADRSAIEWTEATWNPTTGCDRVSAGCDNCYALTLAKRLKAMGAAKYQNDGDHGALVEFDGGQRGGVLGHADVPLSRAGVGDRDLSRWVGQPSVSAGASGSASWSWPSLMSCQPPASAGSTRSSRTSRAMCR